MKLSASAEIRASDVETMKAQQGETGPSSASKDLMVFSILRDSKCGVCGEELGKGRFLFLESRRRSAYAVPISITLSTCPGVMPPSHDALEGTAPFRLWLFASAGHGAATNARASWSRKPCSTAPQRITSSVAERWSSIVRRVP